LLSLGVGAVEQDLMAVVAVVDKSEQVLCLLPPVLLIQLQLVLAG